MNLLLNLNASHSVNLDSNAIVVELKLLEKIGLTNYSFNNGCVAI